MSSHRQRAERGDGGGVCEGAEHVEVLDIAVRVRPSGAQVEKHRCGIRAAGDAQLSDRVNVDVLDDLSAGGSDGVECRLGREHCEDGERSEDASLGGSLPVDIDDDRRDSAAARALVISATTVGMPPE